MVQQVEEEVADMGFPVHLLDEDGEHKIKVGIIDMHPTLEFKEYRSMLAAMVGVSHNHLTSYFVENKTKHLMTRKVDFSTFGDKPFGCYFLVVMKQRRHRKKKANNKQPSSNTGPHDHLVADDVLINFDDCSNQDNYCKTTTTASSQIDDDDVDIIWPQQILLEMKKKADTTEVVLRSKDDKILQGVFRSPYGPIARPLKVAGCCY